MVQRIVKPKSRCHRSDITFTDNHLKSLAEKVWSEHLLCFARLGLEKSVIKCIIPNPLDLKHSFDVRSFKPMPNPFEHFQMRFRPFGPCQDICHHGAHPKNQPCLLEIDYCVSPICDDVKWPSPDLPTRPPFAVPPDAPAAVAMVQTRMPKMVVKGDKGLQVKPCSW